MKIFKGILNKGRFRGGPRGLWCPLPPLLIKRFLSKLSSICLTSVLPLPPSWIFWIFHCWRFPSCTKKPKWLLKLESLEKVQSFTFLHLLWFILLSVYIFHENVSAKDAPDTRNCTKGWAHMSSKVLISWQEMHKAWESAAIVYNSHVFKPFFLQLVF